MAEALTVPTTGVPAPKEQSSLDTNREKLQTLIAADLESPNQSSFEQDPLTQAKEKLNALVANDLQNQRVATDTMLKQVMGTPTDKAARIQALSQDNNLPIDLVERNFEEVNRADQIKRLQDSLTFSPVLRRQMADPNFAALAYDDTENLGALESTLGVIKNIGKAGYAGLINASEGIVGVAQAPVELAAQVTEPLAGTLLPENPLRRVAHGLDNYRKSLNKAAELKRPKAEGLVSEGFYSGIGSLANSLVLSPLAFLPGGQTAFLTGMSAPIAGQFYGQARDKGLNPVQSLPYAASQGVIEFTFNRLPLHALMKDLQVGAPLYKSLLQQAVLEVPREQAITVLEDLNTWAVLNPEKTGADYLKERPSAAAHTLIATLVGVGGHTTAMHGINQIANRNEIKARQAQQNAEALKSLNDQAKASKLAQNSPESFERFIESAIEDGPVQDIYIDAQALLQSGVAQEVAEISPSVANQLEQASVSGAPIRVPLSEYSTRIAPSDFSDTLLEHIKTEPDGFTQAEAQDYLQNQAQELEQDYERVASEQNNQDEFKASHDRVKELVLNELNEVNRFTSTKNEIDATLIAARTAVRAAQLNTTPEALFERQRLHVVAQRITDGQTYNQDGTLKTDTPEFRNWFGDSKVVDDEGSPLVVYHGTGKDFGEFKLSESGSNTDSGMLGKGFYFSTDPSYASTYARGGDSPNVKPVMLSLQNPFQAANAEDLPKIPWPETMEELAIADQLYSEGLRTELINQGYDGVVFTHENGSKEFVAFSPDQIKSVYNRGTFDPNDPNILHQSEIENLFVGHNLTPEGVLAANDLGGLAAPSIAVGRSDIGFDNYGSITLLADPSLLEDRKIRTFDADIYSPRQPRPTFDIDENASRNFINELDPDGLGLSIPDINTLEGQDGPESFMRSDAVRERYLQEVGKKPRLYNAKVDSAVRKASKLDLSEFEMRTDSRVAKIAAKQLRDVIARRKEAREKAQSEGRRVLGQGIDESLFFEKDGTLKADYQRTFARTVQSYLDSGGKDIGRYKTELNAKFRNEKLLNDFNSWAQEKFNALVKGKRISKGFTRSGNRKYIPYTLENVVKEMTTQLQAGENFNYGAGSVRSRYATELKNLEQIKVRRDQIISKEEFAKVREQANEALENALEELKPFFKYDANGWNYQSDASSALAEGARGIRETFEITPKSQKIIEDLTGYLRSLPTEYFEAKAQRAVQFSEFNTAVVPKGIRKDALQVLKDAGLKIRNYDPKVEGSRTEVIAKQKRLLFQNKQNPRGAFSPETNTIALLKNADLSTFLHEAGHYFFESDIALASEIVEANTIFGDTTASPGEQQILNDVSTLLRWFGIQGDINQQLTEWHNLEFEEKRAYHEKTAEGFERYLFEGKAPSIELQSYFQRFRAWMLNVYKSLKAFLEANPSAGSLNDEVRSVFDRMLATNEEIELAEQGRSMLPMFRTEAEAQNIGMSSEEFADYQAQSIETSQEAVQDLQAKGLRDLQWLRNAQNKEVKKLQNKAKGIRREMRIEARREIMQQPVYRAWDFLTRKMQESDKPVQLPKSHPDIVDPGQDSLFKAVAKLGGIKKEQAISQWGIDKSERIDSGVFGKPVLRVNGGLDLDTMSQYLSEYGYLDVDHTDPNWNPNEFEEKFDAELRGDLQYSYAVDPQALMGEEIAGAATDLQNIGAGRLDLISLESMGFTKDQINVLKARRMTAKEGLHPDLIAELPSIEMSSGDELIKALLEADPPKEAIEALTDAKMLEQYGELATPEAIEREADRAVHNSARARMVATEFNALARATGKPKVINKAARQLADAMVDRLAIRALRPSAYSNAAAKAGKESNKALRSGDIQKAASEKRNQLVNTFAARAAHNARSDVDTGVKYLRKFNIEGTRKNLDIEYLEQIDSLLERFDLRSGQSLKAIDKRKALAEWIASQEELGVEPDIPEYLRRETNRTHYKDLTVEQFKGLLDSIKQIEHLARLKNKLLTDKAKRELDAIVQEASENITNNARKVFDNQKRNTLSSKASHLFRGYMAIHRKMANTLYEMDGFKEGGIMWEYIIRPMNEAGNKEASMRAAAANRLHEMVQPILKGGRMGGKGTYFPTIGRSLNRGEILAMVLNWGNAGNQQRLLDGYGWTVEQVTPILRTVTKAEWQFAQKVWEYFESFRPEISAKERRVSGKEPEWIEIEPITVPTAEGESINLKGGYYPIKYDPNQSGKAGAHVDAEAANLLKKAAYTAATTWRGYTKGRAEEVKGMPLLLSFDGIYQGFNEVIHDLSWHEWLIDANKLLRRLDKPMRDGYGAETVTILKKTVEDIARGDKPAADVFEASLNHLRVGATVAGMGWNLFTGLLQPLGITQSFQRVGPKWIAKGLKEFYGSPMQMAAKVQEINEQSEFMRNRARTLNREIADIQNQLTKSKSKTINFVESTFFILIQKLQMTVDYPTWIGAYEKALVNPSNINQDGTINESRVIALADQAVIDAQSSGQIENLAPIQRGGPMRKLFTNFYSYFSTTFNLAVDATRRTSFKDPVQVARLAGDYLLVAVLPAVLSGLLRHSWNQMRGFDDEELVKTLVAEQLDYLLGMFVGLRELSAGVKFATGTGSFDYSGPAGQRFFSEFTKLGKQINQGELDAALLKSLNNVGGLIFHYPSGQVQRTVQGVSAWVEGRSKNPLAPLTGISNR